MILLRTVWRWVATRAIWFVVIVIVLAAGMYLFQEYQRFDAEAARLSEMQQKKRQLEQFSDAEAARATRTTTALRQAPIRALSARLVEIDREIAAVPRRSVLGVVNAPVEELKDRVRLELLQQERDYVQQLLLIAQATEGLRAAHRRLEQLKANHRAIYERLQANKRRQRRLTDANPVAAFLPWSSAGLARSGLRAEYASLFDRNQAAAQTVKRQMRLIAQLRKPGTQIGRAHV